MRARRRDVLQLDRVFLYPTALGTGADGMKGIVLLASIGAGIGLLLAPAAHADDDWWSRLRLPTIEVVPHPAPNAPDYSTCLLKCAERNDACLRHARSRFALRECRLRGSLCSGDCDRYGNSER